MKSGGPKSNSKRSRQRTAGQQSSAVGKNLEQQYLYLFQLREKVSSLTKKAAVAKRRKTIANEVARPIRARETGHISAQAIQQYRRVAKIWPVADEILSTSYPAHRVERDSVGLGRMNDLGTSLIVGGAISQRINFSAAVQLKGKRATIEEAQERPEY
jgi:hypothetical protein